MTSPFKLRRVDGQLRPLEADSTAVPLFNEKIAIYYFLAGSVFKEYPRNSARLDTAHARDYPRVVGIAVLERTG
jgi:hypothetical protein